MVGGASKQQLGRLKGMTIVKVMKRMWIPLVVLLVIVCGGFIVWRIHGIFGSEKRASYADRSVTDAQPVEPKRVVYEVFGPAGTVAAISYFDVNSQPHRIDGAPLPWSLELTTNSPAVVADIVAQGDSDSIGCRIVVDGKVKAERVSNQVNAFTYCLVQGV